MKVNYDHIDLIERYLDDDLSAEELVMFSEKLDQDPHFNKLYFEMDQLLEGIRRSAKRSTVEEKLGRLENALSITSKAENVKSETQVIQLWDNVMKYKMAVAASLSIIIVSVFIITNTNTSRSSEELFRTYYTPYENIYGAKRGISEKEKLQYAMMAYDQLNYEEAIKIFTEIEVNNENRIQVWMYSGISFLELGQIEKAKENFKNIINKNTGFELQAKWYLGLSYLKDGDIVQARELMEEIKESGSAYHKEAGEILSKFK